MLAWTYPLHIGSYGGVGVRILYVTFGFAPAILFIIGLVIFEIKPMAEIAYTNAPDYRFWGMETEYCLI
ncbi:MAG: PepSY domain-containing protein [Stigonema ocellatum SAG 48.90 = DSM 106950]|nr:PepSY domain-containing protein [Stigonema ocellatum SAG 48.90 = DSM 106950]